MPSALLRPRPTSETPGTGAALPSASILGSPALACLALGPKHANQLWVRGCRGVPSKRPRARPWVTPALGGLEGRASARPVPLCRWLYRLRAFRCQMQPFPTGSNRVFTKLGMARLWVRVACPYARRQGCGCHAQTRRRALAGVWRMPCRANYKGILAVAAGQSNALAARP